MTASDTKRESHVPVVVLGAGLTGMSAALALRAAGIACRVLERRDRVGGHAITVEEQGYRFDRTGHLLHVGDEVIRDLALGWIGPDHRWVERNSVVWSHGVYTAYPYQANSFGLPPEVAYECVMGFVEAQRRPPTSEPADFEQFCLTHFGKGISEHFMIPYNSRLWGVPPSSISAAWCQRFVPIPRLEDVIAGAVGKPPAALGYNARFVYPNRGIGQLSEGMGRALGDVELDCEVLSIHARERRVELKDEVISYQALISSAPMSSLVRLLSDAPMTVRAAADLLRCTHLYYLDVALNQPCGVPYHWVYVPEHEYPFYRVGCYSAFSEQMAPPGKANLYVELVDRAEPDMDQLMPRVSECLSRMGFIRDRDSIAFARLRRIEHAYVIYDHHHQGALETIVPHLVAEQIVSTGRYGGWNYSSMSDALRFGREAADRVAGWLGGE